jgi:hypothetical protein
MPKNKISEFSSTPANNTDIGGIDIAEGCAPSGINNAIRELMAQLKDQQVGTDADNFTVGGNLAVTGTSAFTGAITASGGVLGNLTGNVTGNATGLSATLSFAGGGTGQTTRQDAMDALAGSTTSGQYLRGNGTDVLMSAIQVADVPTLNQNTTGTSAGLTITKETVFAITDGAAFEINPANGGIQTITLGANRTPKGTNFTAGQSVTLMVTAGAFTLTWTDTTFGTSGVKWVGGAAPTLSTTLISIVELWKVGTQVYGAFVGAA